MSNQHIAVPIYIDRDDLERSQELIHAGEQELYTLLEQMMQSLDAAAKIDPQLFKEAEEQIKDLEVEANTLRKDLEKLQKQ